MRFVSYTHEGTNHVGIRDENVITPLAGITDISQETPLDLLREAPRWDDESVDFDKVALRPAVTRPDKIICVGLNYRAHVTESNRDDSEYPVLFTKFTSALIGARDDILLPPEAGFLDYEAELAVVIGRRGRRIAREDALEYVLGLTVSNDITVRDYQYKTHQWLQGKSWDGSTPLGPEIVTLDEARLDAGRIRTIVNGRVEQDSDLSLLIFTVESLISTVSEFTELLPGDIILTGTPGGVGYRREPQLALAHGDVVTVEIDGVGAITNTVRREAAA